MNKEQKKMWKRLKHVPRPSVSADEILDALKRISNSLSTVSKSYEDMSTEISKIGKKYESKNGSMEAEDKKGKT